MIEIKKSENNVVEIKDKWYSPYLLAASYKNFIQFHGSFIHQGKLHYQFSPKAKVLELINQFRQKSESHIPAKDLMEAIDAFWKEISEARNGERQKYGGKEK